MEPKKRKTPPKQLTPDSKALQHISNWWDYGINVHTGYRTVHTKKETNSRV